MVDLITFFRWELNFFFIIEGCKFKTTDEPLNKDLDIKINVKKTKVLVCERENKTRIKIRGNQI